MRTARNVGESRSFHRHGGFHNGMAGAYTLMGSLSGMDEAMCEHGGVVQCFTGDGIMAVFGTPVPFEDTPRARGGLDVAGD